MNFARWVFYIAGGTGLIVILAMFFSESQVNRDQPPPITHPEYFYGFAGVADCVSDHRQRPGALPRADAAGDGRKIQLRHCDRRALRIRASSCDHGRRGEHGFAARRAVCGRVFEDAEIRQFTRMTCHLPGP